MKLTDTVCRTSKPKDKAYKLFDGGGLYLEVMPTGSPSPRSHENSQMKGVIQGLLILLASKKLDKKFTDEQLCEFINIFHSPEADIWADRYMISRERGLLKEILQ